MAGETTQSPGQYMRGSCYALALYLADRTDLQLYGCFSETGALHHAFVADPVSGQGYDGRGPISLTTVLHFRGQICAGSAVRPVERALVAEYAEEARTCPFRPHDPSEAEIRRFIQRGRFPALRRKRPLKSAA